jgi:hypothetical protein
MVEDWGPQGVAKTRPHPYQGPRKANVSKEATLPGERLLSIPRPSSEGPLFLLFRYTGPTHGLLASG